MGEPVNRGYDDREIRELRGGASGFGASAELRGGTLPGLQSALEHHAAERDDVLEPVPAIVSLHPVGPGLDRIQQLLEVDLDLTLRAGHPDGAARCARREPFQAGGSERPAHHGHRARRGGLGTILVLDEVNRAIGPDHRDTVPVEAEHERPQGGRGVGFVHRSEGPLNTGGHLLLGVGAVVPVVGAPWPAILLLLVIIINTYGRIK